MANPYRIVEVKPEWALEQEGMGSKRKFWYRDPDTGHSWLFKYPQDGTGQHWAEKIAAEVADVLDIPHAPAELATFEGSAGVAVESFVPAGRELIHGNQLIESHVQRYDRNAGFRYERHTLDNIWRSFERAIVRSEGVERTKELFSKYLLLDAVLGNTDRHHENWGIVVERQGATWVGSLSPSFDHGSCLGRELRDERRAMLLAEDRVGRYVCRGRGAIYWSEDERHGPSPLRLVRLAAREFPGVFRQALDQVRRVDMRQVQAAVDRVPDRWMSDVARRFAVALMSFGIEQVRRIANE